ncbi:MAG: hypothetical protein JNL10_01120 [Verrucomicrobiales bacterium]|nr:hypothetical protein [Verrucomicrobiales bacterium]
MSLLRSHPGLLIWVILVFAIGIICLIVGAIMAKSGASLRPIYWFAGFALLVGLPQFFGHLGIALSDARRENPKREALATLDAGGDRDALQAAARNLFGPDADPDLAADARTLFSEAISGATRARFASLPGGESVLVAEFPGFYDAQRAWVQYLRITGLNQAGGKGHTGVGYAVLRPTGDRAYIAQVNNLLVVCTGPDDGAIRRRMAAAGFTIPRRAPLGPDPTGSVPASGSSAFGMIGMAGGVALFLVYLLVVVGYFFKGASWSASADPKPGTPRLPEAEVRARIEALARTNTPFRIDRGTRDNELLVTWNFADARWLDLARARGLKRTLRTRLVFDVGSGVARTTDYTTDLEWSAGRGGADLRWKAEVGLVLFQREYSKVLGIQFAPDGSITPNLSYSYSFNPRELKDPLTAIVTQSGWIWRPVVWEGPRWLRWLTE